MKTKYTDTMTKQECLEYLITIYKQHKFILNHFKTIKQ
jgi:hypothetical protein